MINGSFIQHSSLTVLHFTPLRFSINYGKWLLTKLMVTQCVSFGCGIILHGLSITIKVDDLYKRSHCPVISLPRISSPSQSSSLLVNKGGSPRRSLSANGRAFWQLWRWKVPTGTYCSCAWSNSATVFLCRSAGRSLRTSCLQPASPGSSGIFPASSASV